MENKSFLQSWRFRTSTTGSLILQKCIERDGPSTTWRDATVEDLGDFYLGLSKIILE